MPRKKKDHSAENAAFIQAKNAARSAAEEIVFERARQLVKEKWSPAHDDRHHHGELAQAASVYADPKPIVLAGCAIPIRWPWHPLDYKPKDRRRNLVRAGALILAELERLDRKEARLAK